MIVLSSFCVVIVLSHNHEQTTKRHALLSWLCLSFRSAFIIFFDFLLCLSPSFYDKKILQILRKTYSINVLFSLLQDEHSMFISLPSCRFVVFCPDFIKKDDKSEAAPIVKSFSSSLPVPLLICPRFMKDFRLNS